MKTRILRILAFIGIIPALAITILIFLPCYIIKGYNSFEWFEMFVDFATLGEGDGGIHG